MTYEQTFLFSLLITLLSETPVVLLLAHNIYKKNNTSDIIFAGIIASSLTLPYFWFILPLFIPNRIPYVFIGESLIVLIEAYIYSKIIKLTPKQSFVVSLIANITSILVGIFFQKIGVL